MSENRQELRRAYEFIKDFWQFIKHYYVSPADPDSEYWHAVMTEAESLGRKYDELRLAKLLILAFLDYLEEEQRCLTKKETER